LAARPPILFLKLPPHNNNMNLWERLLILENKMRDILTMQNTDNIHNKAEEALREIDDIKRVLGFPTRRDKNV